MHPGLWRRCVQGQPVVRRTKSAAPSGPPLRRAVCRRCGGGRTPRIGGAAAWSGRRTAAQVTCRRAAAWRPAPKRSRPGRRSRIAPTELRREHAACLDKVEFHGLARPGAPVTGDSVEEVGRGDAKPVHERLLGVPARARPGRRPAGHAGQRPRTRWRAPLVSSVPVRYRAAAGRRARFSVILADIRRSTELLLAGDSSRHPGMFRIIFQVPCCTFLYRQVSYRPRERYGGASPFMLDRGTGVSGSPKQVPWLALGVPVHSTTTEPIAALQHLQGSH